MFRKTVTMLAKHQAKKTKNTISVNNKFIKNKSHKINIQKVLQHQPTITFNQVVQPCMLNRVKSFVFIDPKKGTPINRTVDQSVQELLRDISEHLTSFMPAKNIPDNVLIKISMALGADWLKQTATKRLNKFLIAYFSRKKDKNGFISQQAYDEVKCTALPVIIFCLLVLLAVEEEARLLVRKELNKNQRSTLEADIDKFETTLDIYENIMDRVRDKIDEHTDNYEANYQIMNDAIAALQLIEMMEDALNEDSDEDNILKAYLAQISHSFYATFNVSKTPVEIKNYLEGLLDGEEGEVAAKILKYLEERDGNLQEVKKVLSEEHNTSESEVEKEKGYLEKKNEKQAEVVEKIEKLQKGLDGATQRLHNNHEAFDKLHQQDYAGRLFDRLRKRVVSKEEETVEVPQLK